MLSASFGALNTTFHFIKLLYKIQGVPSEAKNFLKLISRVEKDCQDYERAEGNYTLGIGAILDGNMNTMDDVFYS